MGKKVYTGNACLRLVKQGTGVASQAWLPQKLTSFYQLKTNFVDPQAFVYEVRYKICIIIILLLLKNERSKPYPVGYQLIRTCWYIEQEPSGKHQNVPGTGQKPQWFIDLQIGYPTST